MTVESDSKPLEEKELACLIYGHLFGWVWGEGPRDDAPTECRECGGGLVEKVLASGDREFSCSCGWRWRG